MLDSCELLITKIVVVITETRGSVDVDGGGTKEEMGGARWLLMLLLHPTIVVMCFAVVVAPLVWSSLQPTIEPHLRSVTIVLRPT